MSFRYRNLFMAVGLAGAFLMGQASQLDAAVTFNFLFQDDPGIGFNDSTLGQARRDALTLAGTTLGSTAFGNYNATIDIIAKGDAPAFALAGASSQAGDNPSGGGFGRTGVVRDKVLSNGASDLNGSDADGSISYNFLEPWELDMNTTVAAPALDFYSTVYHELTHALGWAHSILDTSGQPGGSGRDPFGDGTSTADGGTGADGEWNKFDEFISDKNSANIINSGSLLNNSVSNWDILQVGGTSPDNGLFFDGPNAVSANGGNLVGLYSPDPISGGSSITHLDDNNPAFTGMMMLQATDAGPGARTFSAIELGVLRDLGYTQIQQIGAVPEPTSIALIAIGLVGMAMGHRKRG